MAAGAYEAHLRQIHRLYFFRGVRHSYNDVFILLLNLLTGPKPDAEAWRALSVVAREDHGPAPPVSSPPRSAACWPASTTTGATPPSRRWPTCWPRKGTPA